MDLGLAGKVALVTGGSRTIGFAVARRLGLEGAKVAICARGEERLGRAAERLRAEGIEVFSRRADVTRPDEVAALVDAVVEQFGGLDVLVNNPGGIMRLGPFSQVEPEVWRQGWDLNVMSVVRVTQAALPHLRARPWGRIVNFSAFYLAPPVPGLFTDVAENVVAKTGVAVLTKVMAEELAPEITVNCVAPGPVGADHPRRHEASAFPVPRPADPDELADLVAYLCSRQAGYLTGLTIPFDGGATRRVL